MQKTISRPPSIRIAFRTLGRTLRHSYDNIAALGILSVFWLVCTLPLLPLLLLLLTVQDLFTSLAFLGATMMVGLGPPTAALHRITQRMSEERAMPWSTFWQHLRAEWRWSLALVWTLLLGLFLLDANRRFYNAAVNTPLPFVGVFFFVITLVWLGMMLFAIPIALRQTDQRLLTTLRNTAIIVLGNLPGVLVSLILLLLSSLLLLVLPPLFLILPGYIALWGEENVRLLLVASGHLQKDEIADRPGRGLFRR